MRPLAGTDARIDWYPTFYLSILVHALGQGFKRALGSAQIYVIEHRNARVAEELHQNLWRLSDAELARRGLARERLAQFIKAQG